jgi:hypothetical protein
MTPKKRLWLYELSFWVLVVLIVQNHFWRNPLFDSQ